MAWDPKARPRRVPPRGGNEILDDEGKFAVEVGPRPETWSIVSPRYPTPPRAVHWYPLRVGLSLSSPTEIRFPRGRIAVTVKDEDGHPLPAVGYVDREPVEGKAGTIDLRGVPAGPHLLIVGARGTMGRSAGSSSGRESTARSR